MIVADDFDSVKRKVERMKSLRSEKQGQLKQLLAKLKEDFHLESEEAGEKACRKLEKAEREQGEAYMEAYAQFKQDNKEALEKI